MTKTAKASDPYAAVRKALTESVDSVTAQQRQAAEKAHAEFVKAKDLAAAQAEKAQSAVQANVDAVVAAGEIVTAGAEKMADLLQSEVSRLAESRVAAVKKLIGATSLQDVVAIQTELLKAEQDEAKSFVESVAALARGVTEKAANPVGI